MNRFNSYVYHYEVNVPDIVHYIRFGEEAKCFTQEQANNLISVVENHRPSTIYIHTDDVETVRNLIPKLFSKHIQRLIEVKFYPQPKHIFGLNFSDTYATVHMVDFVKLKLLR